MPDAQSGGPQALVAQATRLLAAGGVVVTGQRCSGKSSRTGEPCKRWASHGATCCATHGGSIKRVKAAAARRLAAEQAMKTLTLLGHSDPTADPTRLLQRELADLSGMVAHLRTELGKMDGPDLLTGPGRGVLDLHADRQEKLIKVCAAAVNLGIESKWLELSTMLVSSVAGVIRAVVDGLGLDDDQRRRALQIAADGMRSMQRTVPALAIEAGDG